MKIPPIFLHSNVVRVPMGCSILNMLFHLDLFLLEVLFIYTFKMSGKWIFSLFDHILSLQLVMGLPDSTKGATKGTLLFRVGLLEHSGWEFEPHRSLAISGRIGCSSFGFTLAV